MKSEVSRRVDPHYRKKQIAVIVLLAVLLIAILTQPSNDDGDTTRTVQRPSAAVVTPVAAAGSPMTEDQSSSLRQQMARLTTARPLPRMSLDQITQLELLAPEPTRTAVQPVVHYPRVQAVYGTSTDQTALVGDSILRPGQPLPSGGKVLQVTTDGVEIGR